MHGRYAANSRLANSSLIRSAFHLGKKPGNFGGSRSGIFDWYNVVLFGRQFEISAGIRLNLAVIARCLRVFLAAALSKVFRKA